MKKFLFIVCALCATLVNAQTDMTAYDLQDAMAGKVYFNNDLYNNPFSVLALSSSQGPFWATNTQLRYNGPHPNDCPSINYVGNGKYTTECVSEDYSGLAITFTVADGVVTQFEVTSTHNSEEIPVGTYTLFNPGTLSNSCTSYTIVFLGGNTFMGFNPGTTTMEDNFEYLMNYDIPFLFDKNYLRLYMPQGLKLCPYNVYSNQYFGNTEIYAFNQLGESYGGKLVEYSDVTFILNQNPIPSPTPDLDPEAEYVVVTYKEGSDTKKAYYKASDVEKIEWLKGEDITE